MLRARRGVMLTSGNSTRAAERGLAYERTRKNKQAHGGLNPRMGATDLWDVGCWCGWSKTGLERRDLAVDAASAHVARTKVGKGKRSAKPPKVAGRSIFRGGASTRSSAAAKATKRSKLPKAPAKKQAKKQTMKQQPRPVAGPKKKKRKSNSGMATPRRGKAAPKAALEPRVTVVFEATRVDVDQVADRRWEVNCTRCPFRSNLASRTSAVGLAKQHAMRCVGRLPKKSSKRRKGSSK
jgi:hypothetical protein